MERGRLTDLSPKPSPPGLIGESQTGFPERTHHGSQSTETTPLTNPGTNPPAALQPPSTECWCAPLRRRRPAARQCPHGSARPSRPAAPWRASRKAKRGFPNEPTMDPNLQKPSHLPSQERTHLPPFSRPARSAGARPSAVGGMRQPATRPPRARPALSRNPCYVTWSAGAPIRKKRDDRL